MELRFLISDQLLHYIMDQRQPKLKRTAFHTFHIETFLHVYPGEPNLE
jgi:hypothetical protein